MSIKYTVCAEVIDIRTDTPCSEDVFFVDTNVWYWLAYTKASQADYPPSLHQITNYPNYIKKALSNKSTLYWCGLNFAELAHLVEKTELEIYKRSNNLGNSFKLKQFRHNYPSERQNVLSEIESMCIQLKMMATSCPTSIDTSFPVTLLNNIKAQPLDGYDLIMVDAINKLGVVNIITDDGDFSCVPGMRIFTANRNVIQTATLNGKIASRASTQGAAATAFSQV